MHVIMVRVFGIVALGALLTSVVSIAKSRRRVNEMAADLDNTRAELGVQRDRASSLQRTLNIRDAFIELNFVNGPEAHLAAAFGNGSKRGRDSHPDEADDGLFVVGSDDESDYDDEGGEWSTSANDGGSPCSPWSPIPVAAVRIRPSEIKTVTLQLRRIPTQGVPTQDVDLGTIAAEGGQPGTDDGGPPEADLQDGVTKEGVLQDQYPREASPDVVSLAQISRYWMDNTIETPSDAPSPAKGNLSAEADTRTAEVDQGR